MMKNRPGTTFLLGVVILIVLLAFLASAAAGPTGPAVFSFLTYPQM